MTSPATSSSDTSQLCVSCAMCCNGTLYGRAKVASGEESRVLGLGLELLAGEDKSYFKLPCSFECGGKCTIYETRFAVCRSFQCALLKRVESGEVDSGRALAIVAEAQTLLRAVVAGDPDAATNGVRAQVRARLAEEIGQVPPEQRGPVARRLLNIVALDTFLERWFRNKKLQPQAAGDDAAAASNS